MKIAVEYKSMDFMGLSRYRVGNDGSIWKYAKTRKAWRKLRPMLNSGGYLQVCLYHDRKPKYYQVHRIVLLAFVGPCPRDMETRHFPDRDKTNNSLANLQWGTKEQNNGDDKAAQGASNLGKRYNQGVSSGRAKLSDATVVEIRERFATGKVSQVQLATEYGMGSSMISAIVRGRYWGHIGGPLTEVGHGKRPLKGIC